MIVCYLRQIVAGLFAAMIFAGSVTAADVPSDQSSGSTPATQPEVAPVQSTDEAQKAKFDVKNIFRNICGFCHEDYGRRAAKGPQLMHSERSDEFLFNRIKHGMPGRMAAWGSIFDDDQIRLIIKFIRSLQPDKEPQNP